jgi:hypothetical protein
MHAAAPKSICLHITCSTAQGNAIMNHYLRFVRTLALSSTLAACSSSDPKAPPAGPADKPAEPARIAAGAADAGAGDASQRQAEVDAAALADAQGKPFVSGPLAPPEMPLAMRSARA